MKAILAAAIATMALTSAPLAAETRAERNEARLAKMIEGRTAGEPQNCISALRSNDLQVIDYVGIVYERGDTIWVARTSRPRDLGAFDVPIIERHGSQLCNTDIIRTIDRATGMHSGVVFLEDFVPYSRPEEG